MQLSFTVDKPPLERFLHVIGGVVFWNDGNFFRFLFLRVLRELASVLLFHGMGLAALVGSTAALSLNTTS